ncbi:MAG: hypothetical protein AAFO75_01985, partial [Pseudomonadota bacterium]
VSSSCTIGGISTPAAATVTIPTTASGSVSTAAINRSFSSVACSSPATVQITSINGGVRNAASAPSGFRRIIDYSSTATFSGASATLNTATVPGATGAENSGLASTTGSAPSGTLSVVIIPQANVQPLISGTYSDTLRVTITPQ